MEERIKLDSLKDVLVELQKLQLEYHGKYVFGIRQYNNDTIKVWLDNMDEYYDWLFSKYHKEEWEETYNRVLYFLNKINNEE